MKIIFGVLLFLITVKCFKAGYIESKEGSGYSIMWFAIGLLCLIGGIALCIN